MFCECPYPITVAEMHEFRQAAEELMVGSEVDELVEYLAFNPDGGEVIPNTGGVRELLWKKPGVQDGRGVWVAYFFYDLNIPLYVLSVSKEDDHSELTDSQCDEVKSLVEELVKEHSRRLRESIQFGA